MTPCAWSPESHEPAGVAALGADVGAGQPGHGALGVVDRGVLGLDRRRTACRSSSRSGRSRRPPGPPSSRRPDSAAPSSAWRRRPSASSWLLVSTKPKSSPGNEDADTVPCAICGSQPLVLSPTAPQCPAVTKPPCHREADRAADPVVDEVRVAAADVDERAGRLGRGDHPYGAALARRPGHDRRCAPASLPGRATTTTVFADTSTYQPEIARCALAARGRGRCLTRRERPRCAPRPSARRRWRRTASAAPGSVTATLSWRPSPLTQPPAKLVAQRPAQCAVGPRRPGVLVHAARGPDRRSGTGPG